MGNFDAVPQNDEGPRSANCEGPFDKNDQTREVYSKPSTPAPPLRRSRRCDYGRFSAMRSHFESLNPTATPEQHATAIRRFAYLCRV